MVTVRLSVKPPNKQVRRKVKFLVKGNNTRLMIAKIQSSHNRLLDQESDNIHHLIAILPRKLKKAKVK